MVDRENSSQTDMSDNFSKAAMREGQGVSKKELDLWTTPNWVITRLK